MPALNRNIAPTTLGKYSAVSGTDEEANCVDDKTQAKIEISAGKRATLKVGGMTCSNCSAAVARALEGMKQVKSCEVDLIGEKATVCYNPNGRFTAKNLCEEVEDIGFEAQVVEDVQIETGEDMEGARAVLHLLDALSPKASVSCVRSKEGVVDASAEATLLKVVYDPSKIGARALLASLKADGFTAVSVAPQELVTAASHSGSGAAAGLGSALFCTTGIVTVCWILPCFVHCRPFLQKQVLPGLDMMTLLICTLATPVQLHCAWRFHVGAIHAIKSGVWDMNVLISLGTGLTYFYSLGVVLFAAVGPKLFGFHECKMPPASYFEAPCLVITFILLGKSLEGWAKRKTSKSLRDLLKLQPRTAHLLRDSAGGEQVENIATELLELKDVVHVFPGEAAPADGVLVSEAGTVAFDESLLTGESRPVTKGPGHFIIGGSKCVTGRAEVQVERLGSKTMLSQITALVERAQLARAPVQQVADSIAHRFVPFVVSLASITWLIWWALVFKFNQVTIVDIHNGQKSEWPQLDRVFFVLEHGLNVLLVACPCALGLATPTAVMTSTGVAAQYGILVRSGAVPLELGSKVTVVVLDKTGTLTQGRPRVEQVGAICPLDIGVKDVWDRLITAYREVRSPAAARSDPVVATAWLKAAPSPGGSTQLWLPDSNGGDREQRRDDAERALWWAIGSAELSSEHPLAKELVDVAGTVTRGALMKPSHFENVTGVGVRCELGNLRLEVCSAAHILQLGGNNNHALSEWVRALRPSGSTVIGVAVDGVPLVGVALKDALVPHARSCVAELQMAGMEVWMCSGDHATAATSVARDCGIDGARVVAEALPADKVAVVQKLQVAGRIGGEKHVVAMVGDGVNDAPALAAADIGVAIGAGHDVTVDAADIVLVRTDLRDLTTFFALARQTLWTIKFNFFWAFLFNVSCLPIAAGALWRFDILMTPQIAACLMLSSSLFVCFNSLRLRTFSPNAFACKV